MRHYSQNQNFNEHFFQEQGEVGSELYGYITDLKGEVATLQPLSKAQQRSILAGSRQHIEDIATKHGFTGQKQKELLSDFYTTAMRVISGNSP
tara:strand:- start:460 stop:738 length:279 start_codon:yes stop_codon:yes gene_type:complete